MPSSLQDFFNNKGMKDNVQAYLIEFLKQEAIKKVFEREETSGVSEAKELIDKAFENLEVLFSPKPKEKSIINEAR